MKRLYSADAPRGWMPPGWLAPILCIVLVAIPDAAGTFALRPFHLVDAHDDPTSLLGWCAFLVVTFGLMGLVFAAWVRFVERRPLATIGLAGARGRRTFLMGCTVGVGGIAAIVTAIGLAGGYQVGGILPAFASPRALLGIAALFPCFALQSSVEEIIFRGWLLSGIARKLNLPVAVTLSSATFTLLHYERGQHWATTLGIVLFAVFACAWAIRAGNVWGVMGWHAAWNWLCAVGFDLPVTGMRSFVPALIVRLTPFGGRWLTGATQGPEGSVFTSLFFVAGIAVMAWRGQRSRV